MTPEAIARIAWEALARARQRVPPVDIDAVADAEGLSFHLAVLETASGGYFRDLDGRGHAVISSNEHRLRQRFTKAHELGHHLLDPAVPQGDVLIAAPAFRRHDRHWPQMYFAGSLLMPRPWMANFFRARGVGLASDELVAEVARRFDVSRPAALVRLRELRYVEDRR